MKIKKHGDTYNKGAEEKKEKFKCENCGCEFTAEEDEYYRDYGGADAPDWTNTVSLTYTVRSVTKDYLVCSCPECYKIVKKIKERKSSYSYTFSSPTVTYANQSDGTCVTTDGTCASAK